MARLLPLVAALALGVPAAAFAARESATHSSGSRHPYSVARVQDAFRSQGIPLWRQNVPPSAGYARLTSSGSLRIIVFRSTKLSERARIEVDLGHPPKHHKRGSIVIHLRDPHGSKAHAQQTSIANLALVYLKSAGLDSSVSGALHHLRHS